VPRLVRTILGIDPGLEGALAWVRRDGVLVEIEDMAVVNRQVNPSLLSKLIVGYGPLECAVVEVQHTFPKQGISSAFKLGVGYGVIQGILATLDIPTFYLTPAVWKKSLNLDNDKEKSRRLAIERWPGEATRFSRKKDHGRAEAALIAIAWLRENGAPEPRQRVIPPRQRVDTVD
jgi:crossover junction endodeoxyribonuclease RuvC